MARPNVIDRNPCRQWVATVGNPTGQRRAATRALRRKVDSRIIAGRMEKPGRCPYRTYKRCQLVCWLNLLANGGFCLCQRLLRRLQRLFSNLLFIASSAQYCASGDEHSVSSCGHGGHSFGFNCGRMPGLPILWIRLQRRRPPFGAGQMGAGLRHFRLGKLQRGSRRGNICRGRQRPWTGSSWQPQSLLRSKGDNTDFMKSSNRIKRRQMQHAISAGQRRAAGNHRLTIEGDINQSSTNSDSQRMRTIQGNRQLAHCRRRWIMPLPTIVVSSVYFRTRLVSADVDILFMVVRLAITGRIP